MRDGCGHEVTECVDQHPVERHRLRRRRDLPAVHGEHPLGVDGDPESGQLVRRKVEVQREGFADQRLAVFI